MSTAANTVLLKYAAQKELPNRTVKKKDTTNFLNKSVTVQRKHLEKTEAEDRSYETKGECCMTFPA